MAKNEKGNLVLDGAEIQSSEDEGPNSRRIYICSGFDKDHSGDLLFEVSDAQLTDKWKTSIKEHCEFATIMNISSGTASR